MDKTETLKNAGDSIRVTVRISEECRDNIKWLTRYYRTSQKDVFDKLVGFLPLFFKDNGEFLSTLISKSVEETPKSIKVRKSQVMSRRTHKMLGTVSKQFNISRGTLIQGLSYLARMIQ
ncbi:MAG: hypothetical protein H6Q52_1892 [Deltaproteobacteria bacterium]|nr:hypothetical protein [Deltaproteobacteria bacterium]